MLPRYPKLYSILRNIDLIEKNHTIECRTESPYLSPWMPDFNRCSYDTTLNINDFYKTLNNLTGTFRQLRLLS